MVDKAQPVSRTDGETRPRLGHRRIGTSLGAIAAASLASICCVGPVLFVTIGVGAGFASQFEPLRPVFTILAVALIIAGFYSVYNRRGAGPPDASCDVEGTCRLPQSRTRDKVVLWIATLVALVLLTFPWWSLWLL